MNLQQPPTLIPPVHPDVQMKPLPFYDVLDVLIKPSSLGMRFLLVHVLLYSMLRKFFVS